MGFLEFSIIVGYSWEGFVTDIINNINNATLNILSEEEFFDTERIEALRNALRSGSQDNIEKALVDHETKKAAD